MSGNDCNSPSPSSLLSQTIEVFNSIPFSILVTFFYRPLRSIITTFLNLSLTFTLHILLTNGTHLYNFNSTFVPLLPYPRFTTVHKGWDQLPLCTSKRPLLDFVRNKGHLLFPTFTLLFIFLYLHFLYLHVIHIVNIEP